MSWTANCYSAAALPLALPAIHVIIVVAAHVSLCSFQAVAVGSSIYIHHHRCEQDILVLDVGGNQPVLRKVGN
jgi:hypothetical protein